MPRPYGYVADLAGREAFVMERLDGETIGRRIVQKPELAAARAALPLQLAEELAKVHAIPAARVPFLVGGARRPAGRRARRRSDEPHPAIELGLWWLREHRPPARPPVVSHGDFRIGNVVVDEHGLVGLLDWEFAHLDDSGARPLVRRSCARGASASTRSGSAASATSSRTSSATTS